MTIKVVVQGAGFVGAAFAVACASRKFKGKKIFDVKVIEKESKKNVGDQFNKGTFPFKTNDKKLNILLKKHINKNLKLIYDKNYYKNADIVICCIGFDSNLSKLNFTKNAKIYLKNIKEIAQTILPNRLVVIQSTLPPGFSNKYIIPLFVKEFVKRGLDTKDILLAHSFERVMPGKNYLDSIINNWRVCSVLNQKTLKKTKFFFPKLINTKKFPMIYFNNLLYSEVAKILENSYRAINISIIDEWSKFAELAKINLYEIIDAIKLRPSHSNIMYPGFGVGGYCLTKDPKFIDISSKHIFKFKNLKFRYPHIALKINKNMPLRIFEKIYNYYSGSLKLKKFLILGVSYKDNVADTRKSPTEILYNKLISAGSVVEVQDPLVDFWLEKQVHVKNDIPKFRNYDCVVFATNHTEYKNLKFKKYLLGAQKTLIIDTINLLSNLKIKKNFNNQVGIISVGK
jgi:nucleotide sugar dehydrogenase